MVFVSLISNTTVRARTTSPLFVMHSAWSNSTIRVRALDDPAAAQAFLRFEPAMLYGMLHVAHMARAPTARIITALVGMQLRGSKAWPATTLRVHWRNQIE